MAFITAYQAVRIVCEAAEIYNSIDRLILNPNDDTTVKSASIGMNILHLCFTIVESCALSKGTSTTTLKSLKMGETVARGLDLPLKALEQYENPQATTLEFLEKGLLKPLTSLSRSAFESTIYEAKTYLEMNDKELSEVKIPIYDYEEVSEDIVPFYNYNTESNELKIPDYGNSRMVLKVIEYEGITREKAQQMLHSAEQAAKVARGAEVLLSTQVISKTERLYTNLFNMLHRRNQLPQPPFVAAANVAEPAPLAAELDVAEPAPLADELDPAEPAPLAAAANVAQTVPMQLNDEEDDMLNLAAALDASERVHSALTNWGVVAPSNWNVVEDPFDLCALSSIPEELHEDAIFKRYVCPITQCPIRDPVGNKWGTAIFERSAIEAELSQKNRCPLSRRRHLVKDLIPKPALKKLIDKQLKLHSQRLRNFARNLLPAIAHDLQAAADLENPGY